METPFGGIIILIISIIYSVFGYNDYIDTTINYNNAKNI